MELLDLVDQFEGTEGTFHGALKLAARSARLGPDGRVAAFDRPADGEAEPEAYKAVGRLYHRAAKVRVEVLEEAGIEVLPAYTRKRRKQRGRRKPG